MLAIAWFNILDGVKKKKAIQAKKAAEAKEAAEAKAAADAKAAEEAAILAFKNRVPEGVPEDDKEKPIYLQKLAEVSDSSKQFGLQHFPQGG